MTRISTPRRLAVLAAGIAGALIGFTPADADTYQRGPDPTSSALERNGPFAYGSYDAPDWYTPGFGAATVFYPTTTAYTFGGVAISPGYTADRSSIAWYGPRLASHGFVVITFNTNSRYDSPSERATQLLAALDYLVERTAARDRVDPNRLAVMGHSMGGGGAIEATKRRTSLLASVPLTPWHTDKTWPEVVTETMIIGAENDGTAPVATHSEPFYTSMTNTPEKAYLELNNAGHFAPNSDNPTISKYAISWLKRWVDTDTRYDQFLCPPPSPSSAIQEYRATCPHS